MKFTEVLSILLTVVVAICICVWVIDWLLLGTDSFIMKPFKKKHDYKVNQNAHVYVPKGNWITETKQLKDFPKITFNQFRDFYYLNPESWTLCDYKVFKNYRQELTFNFEYEEWKKYEKWHNQIKKEKEIAKNNRLKQAILNYQNETTKKILEEVQKDIDKIRQESQNDIDEAINLIKGVKL